MTKHASVHYLFAAVENIRNNLSDTPAILVMIDTTFKSVHVLWCIRGLELTCWLGHFYFSGLLCFAVIAAFWRQKYSRFICLLLSASSGVSPSLLSLYCSILHWRRSSISIQHEQWTSPSIIQLTHADTVIYSDNLPWHKPLHIPNKASSKSNNLCQIWQSSNLHC